MQPFSSVAGSMARYTVTRGSLSARKVRQKTDERTLEQQLQVTKRRVAADTDCRLPLSHRSRVDQRSWCQPSCEPPPVGASDFAVLLKNIVR